MSEHPRDSEGRILARLKRVETFGDLGDGYRARPVDWQPGGHDAMAATPRAAWDALEQRLGPLAPDDAVTRALLYH